MSSKDDVRHALTLLQDKQVTVDTAMKSVERYVESQRKTAPEAISTAVIAVAMLTLVAFVVWLIVGAVAS